MLKKTLITILFAGLMTMPMLAFAFSLPAGISGIIDMHEHFTSGGNMGLYLSLARSFGIRKTVFVATGSAPNNSGYKTNTTAVLKQQKKYHGKVIAFCGANTKDPGTVAIFEKCLNEGGKGLKLISGHPSFYTEPIDNETTRRLFELAESHNVPVLMHVSIYKLPKAREEFKKLLNDFPNVRVQVAHYCSTIYGNSMDLALCAELLDKYPNVYVDLSMGGGMDGYMKQLLRDKRPIGDFILKYQDRLFYGNDIILTSSGTSADRKWVKARMLCDLESLTQKNFKCDIPENSNREIKIPGLELPKKALKKIFWDNPRKFLNLP